MRERASPRRTLAVSRLRRAVSGIPGNDQGLIAKIRMLACASENPGCESGDRFNNVPAIVEHQQHVLVLQDRGNAGRQISSASLEPNLAPMGVGTSSGSLRVARSMK
jgi:hypothetical protein